MSRCLVANEFPFMFELSRKVGRTSGFASKRVTRHIRLLFSTSGKITCWGELAHTCLSHVAKRDLFKMNLRSCAWSQNRSCNVKCGMSVYGFT